MYEANMAMHECDVMINIGARFDDRVTGRLDAFAPNSKKIHIDIDPSNINKTIKIDVPIIGDIETVMNQIFSSWQRYRAFIKEEVPDEGLKGKTDYDYYQGFDFGLSWEIKLIKSSLHRNINPSNGISIWSLVNFERNKFIEGLVTDGDLRRGRKFLSKKNKLQDFMTKKPFVVNENMSAEKALNIMNEKKIKSLLIVS